MGLQALAAIMSHAQAAVWSVMGLAHMAAVASIPTITLYAVTDTVLIGMIESPSSYCSARWP
jgi:ADP-heptose:LPS heptosyltransferase